MSSDHSKPNCDQIRQAFAAACAAGQQPQAEKYLSDTSGGERSTLLRDLLRIELDHRSSNGDDVVADVLKSVALDSVLLSDGPPSETVISMDGGTMGAAPRTEHLPLPYSLGDYELLHELGVGGMGIVYRARQRSANRDIALKIVRQDRLQSASQEKRGKIIDRFRTEAQAAAQLEHDNIVRVYDVGEIDGRHYFTMRFVEGQSLDDLIRQQPLENRRAAEYGLGLARGLEEAHGKGVLHRDLKPQNVLVDAKTGRVMITDFGLAKLIDQDTGLTRHGEVMGTPSYMSPEQAHDFAGTTTSSDVYSLGATLYHLLVGRPPFSACSPVETLHQVLYSDPVLPHELNRSIDRDLETICMKCLEKDPQRRYASSTEVADELQRYLDGKPIAARPLGRIGRTLRWARRNRSTAALIATIAVSLLLFAGAMGVTSARERGLRQGAEANLDMAREALDGLYIPLTEEPLMQMPILQRPRRALLMKTLAYYRKIIARVGEAPDDLQSFALANYRAGCLTEELESVPAAMPFMDKALETQLSLAKNAPDDRSLREQLSDTWNRRGSMLHRQRDFKMARACYENALELRPEQTAPRKHANTKMNLALLIWDEAMAQVAGANLVGGNGADAKAAEAIDVARKMMHSAQRVRGKLHSVDRTDKLVVRDLAKGSFHLARLEESVGNTDQVRNLSGLASNLISQLGAEREYDASIQQLEASCEYALGNSSSDAPEESANHFRRCKDLLEQLVEHTSDFEVHAARLAEVYQRLARFDYDQQRKTESLTHLRSAADLYRRLSLQEGQSSDAYQQKLDEVRTVIRAVESG